MYNVAIGLGRLEAPVSFFCRISTDFFGDMLLDYLHENGVDTTFCPRSADPTTLAFVSLPGAGKAATVFWLGLLQRFLPSATLPF